MRGLLLFIAVGCIVGGCGARPTAGECPEAEHLRCATEKVCAPNSSRGCMECQCAPPWMPDEGMTPYGDR